MSARRKNSQTPAAVRSRRKRNWIVLAGLAFAGVGIYLAWRFTAPPVPEVSTAGFDSVIAAAIVDARKAATRAPRSAEARGRMGMVLLAHDVRAEARECFKHAAEFAPRDPRWPYFLGLAQLIDQPADAPSNLARAAQLFGEAETAPRLKLGDALLALGRLDEAEVAYRKVWHHNSNSAPAALGLGKIANARDRADEASQFLACATNDLSTRKAAHRLLVNVNQRLGRTNEAERLARVLAELPDDQPAADPVFAEVLKLKTGEQVWLDQADELMKRGRFTEAAALLEKAVQTYPKSDHAMFFLGRARLRLGNAAGAEQVLARAVEIAPGSVEAQMQLGVVRMNRGRWREAEPCFRAAIQAKPNLGEAWFNLGLCLGNDVNRRAESISAFREAIKFKPNLFEAYLGLAIALRADGQNEAAIAELERALQLGPPEPMRQKLAAQLRAAQRL